MEKQRLQRTGIARFREISKNIQTLVAVCNQLIKYAAENGKYSALKSNSCLKLHSAVSGNYGEKEDLWFDLAVFRTNCEMPIPKWAFRICRKGPAERTTEEIRLLCCLMRQMEVFKKYTREMLNLLARATTTERFERGRVIVRKGHIGRSLYVIFNGSVAMLKDGKEESVLKEEPDENEETSSRSSGNKTILKRGDCFGKEALFRTTERQATAVCLSTTDFLVINLDDTKGLGFDQCLVQEIADRVQFFKTVKLFDKVPKEILQFLAEKSSTYQYLSDKIIKRDTKESEFVYFCKKGQCDLLRTITKQALQKGIGRRRKLSGDLDIPFISNEKTKFASSLQLMKRSGISKGRPCLRKVASTSSIQLSNKLLGKENKITQRERCYTDGGHRPQTTYSGWNLGSQLMKQHSLVKINQSNESNEKSSSHLNPVESVIVRVATLFKKDFFGLQKPEKDDDSFAPERSFILVSSGCEMIAIKRSTLTQCLGNEIHEQLLESLKTYPNDEQLYTAFREQLEWRSYRENLVSNLTEKKSNGLTDSVKSWQRLAVDEMTYPTEM